LFGNKIQEVDLARIFTEFPNLKYLNLDYNPLGAKNLNNLTDKQLEKLADGLKNKKIRISASKGTVLMDLLEYTQKLIKKAGSSSSSAHKLQTILESGSVKSEQQNNNSKLP
jgi:ATP-dependent Clp protease ATP-binding subunit ClpA